MSPRFSVAFAEPFDVVLELVKTRARSDPTIAMSITNAEILLAFAGDLALVDAAARDPVGFALVRLIPRDGVMHVDLDGYEGSIDHLRVFVARLLSDTEAAHVWDDETGEDLLPLYRSAPAAFYGAEVEYVDREAAV